MKFKLIFFLFNFMIILSLLLVLVAPVFVIGPDYAVYFLSKYWPIALVFVFVLGLGDGLFAANWKFLALMETGDWDKVSAYLEDKILARKKIQAHELKVLLSIYVVRSKTAKITEMEKFLRDNAPARIRSVMTYLAVPHLVSEDKAARIPWFEEAVNACKGQDKLWMTWCLGMVNMLAQNAARADELLLPLVTCSDRLLNILSAYLLSSREGEAKIAADKVREKVRTGMGKEKFAKFVESRKDNILATLMMKIVDDAAGWIYSGTKEDGTTHESNQQISQT